MFLIIWRFITIILVALFIGLEFAHTLELPEQANAQTIPTNWQQLRNQWEYAHATNFIFTLAGLSALLCSGHY